jgi:hypothetical protein
MMKVKYLEWGRTTDSNWAGKDMTKGNKEKYLVTFIDM